MSTGGLRDEFVGCDFGDARLSKRILELADGFEGNPARSIPATFVTKAEYEACYRFFSNDSVTPQAIIAPHIQATRERIATHDTVYLVQDTTELDLTRPKQQVRGAGPMDSESRRGAFAHPLVAFNDSGVSLGLVHLHTWTRAEISKESAEEKKKKREQRPIEEKESNRWLNGLRAAKEIATACPQTSCICIGDSESDIFQLYSLACELRAKTPNLHLIVRAGQDRATEYGVLWTAAARAAPITARFNVHVRERVAKITTAESPRAKSRDARTAEVQIRVAKVVIKRPEHLLDQPKALELNLVLVEESNPPEGEDPIRWLLVTTMPIDTVEQIQAVIHGYRLRWQIEVYFRTLKSGTKIEYRRFEDIDRILNCLAMFSVVAWRVMYLTYLGRECPDLECEVVLQPSEWKSVYAVLGKPIPPKGCPKLEEVVRAIATLGGFTDRPKQHPGAQTVWIGLQRCFDLSIAWDTFGPGSKKISSQLDM